MLLFASRIARQTGQQFASRWYPYGFGKTRQPSQYWVRGPPGLPVEINAAAEIAAMEVPFSLAKTIIPNVTNRIDPGSVHN
jgi:hypothetical protein